MARRMIFVLFALSAFSSATFSTLDFHNRIATAAPARDPQKPSQTPTGQVSARASDVPPPPLWASKIRNLHVKYIQSAQLTSYPVPAVVFRGEGLAREDDWTEIRGKIIYPAINKSDRSIAAVMVEFFPSRSDIVVTLIWHGVAPSGTTNYASALINRNSSGHFAADAYLRLLPKDD